MASSDELNSARKKLFEKLGDSTKAYCQIMKKWFSMKITKDEFDSEVRKLMDIEQTKLHNEFLLCLFNKCHFLSTDNSRSRNKRAKLSKAKRPGDKSVFQVTRKKYADHKQIFHKTGGAMTPSNLTPSEEKLEESIILSVEGYQAEDCSDADYEVDSTEELHTTSSRPILVTVPATPETPCAVGTSLTKSTEVATDISATPVRSGTVGTSILPKITESALGEKRKKLNTTQSRVRASAMAEFSIMRNKLMEAQIADIADLKSKREIEKRILMEEEKQSIIKTQMLQLQLKSMMEGNSVLEDKS